MGLVPMSNANPVFQTWLLGAFRQAGLWLGSADAGVALYCVTQAVLMAWLLGTLLDGVRRSAAPRWLFWTALVFYALCPIFPVFAFCVGKDTNFAMAVLFLSLMVKRVVDAWPWIAVTGSIVIGGEALLLLLLLHRCKKREEDD